MAIKNNKINKHLLGLGFSDHFLSYRVGPAVVKSCIVIASFQSIQMMHLCAFMSDYVINDFAFDNLVLFKLI